METLNIDHSLEEPARLANVAISSSEWPSSFRFSVASGNQANLHWRLFVWGGGSEGGFDTCERHLLLLVSRCFWYLGVHFLHSFLCSLWTCFFGAHLWMEEVPLFPFYPTFSQLACCEVMMISGGGHKKTKQ